MTEKRNRGLIRVSIHSVMKALYGDMPYKAVIVKVSRTDKSMLDITIDGPDLPEWSPGKRLQRINITRKYEQTQE